MSFSRTTQAPTRAVLGDERCACTANRRNSELLAKHRLSAGQRARSVVGAGTKDTGFSLTRLTFQVTHATDADTNGERDYIVAELTRNLVIGGMTLYRSGDEVGTDRVNRYIADGDVAVASLVAGLKAKSGLTSGLT